MATLDALGETLVPGAKQAGITNFVDQHLRHVELGAFAVPREWTDWAPLDAQ